MAKYQLLTRAITKIIQNQLSLMKFFINLDVIEFYIIVLLYSTRSPLLYEEKDKEIKTEHIVEKMEILSGSNKIIKRAIDDFHKIKERFDNCTDSTGPSVFYNTPIWNEYVNLSKRGIKLRFIAEITKDISPIAKNLLK